MLFGLTNAPATFQALMNSIFRPFLRRFVSAFLDDILVYSKNLEDHRDHLAKVLVVLKRENLFANKKKCVFGHPSMEYLGHVISGEGVAADPSKVVAILTWPTPESVRDVRVFGAHYYWCFVRGNGEIARPLTNLLKFRGFEWDERANQAFAALKRAITSLPVLAMPELLRTL